MRPLTTQQQEKMINEAANKFPEEFGLRAFPGARFKISRTASYISSIEGVMLYTMIKKEDGWRAFCKGTTAELQKEIV